jgi:radical SAM superfamily enzyme YgiQ (UPF0313 family)
MTGTTFGRLTPADHYRDGGIPVVLGGPHITLIPEDAQPHADSIVIGYAEDTWPQLLRDFAAGHLSLANRPFPRRELVKAHRYLTTHVFEATRA